MSAPFDRAPWRRLLQRPPYRSDNEFCISHTSPVLDAYAGHGKPDSGSVRVTDGVAFGHCDSITDIQHRNAESGVAHSRFDPDVQSDADRDITFDCDTDTNTVVAAIADSHGGGDRDGDTASDSHANLHAESDGDVDPDAEPLPDCYADFDGDADRDARAADANSYGNADANAAPRGHLNSHGNTDAHAAPRGHLNSHGDPDGDACAADADVNRHGDAESFSAHRD